MWTKCLPRDTIQPMESTLRNSNEIICKHRNLRLQVPGKVGAECGLIVPVGYTDVTRSFQRQFIIQLTIYLQITSPRMTCIHLHLNLEANILRTCTWPEVKTTGLHKSRQCSLSQAWQQPWKAAHLS